MLGKRLSVGGIFLLLVSCIGKSSTDKQILVKNMSKASDAAGTWISLQEKESIDGYTKIDGQIFGGEVACNVKPLENIDAATFQVLAGTKYAKDKNQVYYPIRTTCVDYTDCGVCYYADILVKGADPQTFRYLNKGYAIDRNQVFFRGEEIKNADSKSFRVLDGPEYFYFAKDGNMVYYLNQYFRNADAAAFYFDRKNLLNVTTEYEQVFIVADNNHHWAFSPPGRFKQLD